MKREKLMAREGAKEEEEEEERNENSQHEESYVWWWNAWWVRVNNGPHMRTARGRRRNFGRAARQAAEQACHEEWSERRRVKRRETDGEEREEREKGTSSGSGRGGSGSSASPLRSWSGLWILRLALRCPMSTSLLWKRSPSCNSIAASETSPTNMQ